MFEETQNVEWLETVHTWVDVFLCDERYFIDNCSDECMLLISTYNGVHTTPRCLEHG